MLHDKVAHIKDKLCIWHLQDLDARTMRQVLQHKWLHPRIHHQIDDNIDNHHLRSNQGEGYPASGLQGIWGCILQENPHEITILPILQPHHWTQRLVCTPMGQGLPTKPHQTPSLQWVCQRTPQDRRDFPLKIPSSCAILLCQEERSRETMPLPRLLVFQ